MPPKAPVPLRARPLRDTRSPTFLDQPEANPAGAVEESQDSLGNNSTQPLGTTVQSVGTHDVLSQTEVPTIITPTLKPQDPKGKHKATSATSSRSNHSRGPIRHPRMDSTTSLSPEFPPLGRKGRQGPFLPGTGQWHGPEPTPALIEAISQMLDAKLANRDSKSQIPSIIGSTRSSEVPLKVKKEPKSENNKKTKTPPSKHRFTTVDSDEDSDEPGDVNVKFDTVKFYGKTGTKDEVETFIANNELIFNLKAKQFRTDSQKINFMATLFRDAAARWYAPYQGMQKRDKPLWCLSYTLFVQELIDEYGDPKQMESASDRILELKMKPNQDVREYYREFSEIAIKLTDWGQASFARLFLKGLTPEIQQLISNANNDFPKTLKGMRDVAVQAYRRKESIPVGHLKREESDKPRGMYNVATRTQTSTSSKLPDPVPRFTAQYPRSAATMGNFSSRPPFQYGRSQEEKERLISANKCLGCEQVGHRYADCPANPQKNLPGMPKTQARVVHISNPDEVDGDDHQDDFEEPKNGPATLT